MAAATRRGRRDCGRRQRAAADGAAAARATTRGGIFRIDDITHERPGGMAADGQHRQRISAVNAIDNEPFPEIGISMRASAARASRSRATLRS